MTELLPIHEYAAELRVPLATARYWRQQGTGPKTFKVGRRVVTTREALDAYLAEQQQAAR